MTYDWARTLALEPGSREWFGEIDRRFLASAYYAESRDGTPFGRFLRPCEIRNARVLEVGCGMGTHAAMLARAGARLTAVDITRRSVEMTRRRFALFGLSGVIAQADAEHLPFADGSFDVIWTWGVIHHSRSTERCLTEISRVLRPGGRLIAMVYHRRSLVYYVHAGLIRGVLLGRLARRSLQDVYTSASDGAYARVFTARELRALLRRDFDDVALSILGLKAELWPIPRSRLKDDLVRWTPDRLARLILDRCGSMVVLQACKR